MASLALKGSPLLLATIRAVLRRAQPPPDLTLSQWAERYGVLSRETSAQPGRFEAFAYQTGIMDAVTDSRVVEITVMKSARVGYTRILDHAIGFFVHQDPSPILVVQPRVEDAEDYSTTEIEPMLRDTRVLAEITGEQRSSDPKQRMLKRTFRNGASITFIGANSAGGFRRITARVVLFDEVDGYPPGGVGAEGDQIALGIKRADSFWNRVIMAGSTPTVAGVSRIEKRFHDSDQRYFFVPCPHCGEKQRLEWGGPNLPYGIKWNKNDKGIGLPETVHYVCRANGCIIEEFDKAGMIAGGEWRATRPFTGHAGFHIWAGYSLFVNARWAMLVAEWLRVKDDPLQRKTFHNLVLGLPYEDRGQGALNERTLAARTEVFAAEVPDGVAVVTAGVDVQDDRVEIEVVGWGRNEESWSIAHEVIEGDPDTTPLWDQVDAFLKRIWKRGDGRGFEIMATCIDSGGHHTQRVYNFSRDRLGRRVWAIKGEAARGGARSPVWPTKRPSARNKAAFRPVIIGVNAAKDVIRSRLAIKPPLDGAIGPIAGYMHFPADRDINYFAQLVSERSVTKMVGGRAFRVWELMAGRANEALDMRVYAYAALCGLLHYGLKLNRRAEVLAGETTLQDTPVAEATPWRPGAQPPPPPAPAAVLTAEAARAARIARMTVR